MKIKMETFKLNDENDRNLGLDVKSITAKRGYFYYQDRLASPRKRAPVTPKRGLSPLSVPLNVTPISAVLPMSPKVSRSASPKETKRYRTESPSLNRRKSSKLKHRRSETEASPSRFPLMTKPVCTFQNKYYWSGNSGSFFSSPEPLASVVQTDRTLLETWDPPCAIDWKRATMGASSGPQYVDNTASTSGFTNHNNSKKIPITSENWENEDPVRGEEDHQSESTREEDRSETDTDSHTETTETDGEELDSILGLVQKDETDTAEEDEFGGLEDDTDSASENEFRTNDYYNSPKPVVSINEVPDEGDCSLGLFEQALPRLTVSMNFEETDQYGNKSVRAMYQSRCEELSLKIGTLMDPYHPKNRKSFNLTPSQHVQELESDLVIADCFERPITSGDSSPDRKTHPSSGLVSISSSSDELGFEPANERRKMGKSSIGRLAQGRFLRKSNPTPIPPGTNFKFWEMKYLTAPEGNINNLIVHWLNHPLANVKRFSYFDEDQQ